MTYAQADDEDVCTHKEEVDVGLIKSPLLIVRTRINSWKVDIVHYLMEDVTHPANLVPNELPLTLLLLSKL